MKLRPLPPPGRTHVMGVLNLSPDSFSDGGALSTAQQVVDTARRMVSDGAAVLDLGAVSTRPGAAPVTPSEEWRRLADVLGPLRDAVSVPLSLDTSSAEVTQRALAIGIDLLNDVSALAADPDLAPLAAQAGLPVVLMHRRGTPADMQRAPHYENAPAEVQAELLASVQRAEAAGLPREGLLLDPGIGFGKRLVDNLALLAALRELGALGFRTLLGCSRKSFLGTLTGRPVTQREHATSATTVLAAQAGVDFVRVHRVDAASDALAVIAAVERASRGLPPVVPEAAPS
ncbi:MAG: dihydropteroate synthase [Planctomycetota bacterium]|nr:MAG: dihydropteroate synthase [Planctomycetota bacterium]